MQKTKKYQFALQRKEKSHNFISFQKIYGFNLKNKDFKT
jgi:hypothetical protein